MENNLYIDERLEQQKISEYFAQYKELDPKDEKAQSELMNNLIGELVMNTRLIAPVAIKEGKDGKKNIVFQLIKSTQGENFFPVFTASEELEKWEGLKDYRTIQLIFDNYAQMLAANDTCGGFVVNPFSDNFRVSKQSAQTWYEHKQMIVQGHASHMITKDSKYEVYAPSPFPFRLSDKLCETAKDIPDVKRIWLRGIKLDGTDGYLAVVEFGGDREKTLSALGNGSRDYLNGMPIHFVAYAPGFAEQAVKDVIPIYAK